ncbi:hypothetical protein, partial [Burkholderia mallei]|uniref:hypothetical protein n=1 Tax=Burkholderia mallei TaxID=13373 RepID=UPI001C53B06A
KVTGKYGTATILQEGTGAALACGIHYQFNKTGVSNLLVSKEIVLKLDEASGTLKMENMGGKTNGVENRYLPSAFKKPS